jgi:hypothetical protein
LKQLEFVLASIANVIVSGHGRQMIGV